MYKNIDYFRKIPIFCSVQIFKFKFTAIMHSISHLKMLYNTIFYGILNFNLPQNFTNCNTSISVKFYKH